MRATVEFNGLIAYFIHRQQDFKLHGYNNSIATNNYTLALPYMKKSGILCYVIYQTAVIP